jgi:excisionase family DNA binding protein
MLEQEIQYNELRLKESKLMNTSPNLFRLLADISNKPFLHLKAQLPSTKLALTSASLESKLSANLLNKLERGLDSIDKLVNNKDEFFDNLLGERFLSLKEASIFLGVSVTTIRRWLSTGKLPGYLLPSNRKRFKKSDLLSVMKKCRDPRSRKVK